MLWQQTKQLDMPNRMASMPCESAQQPQPNPPNPKELGTSEYAPSMIRETDVFI